MLSHGRTECARSDEKLHHRIKRPIPARLLACGEKSYYTLLVQSGEISSIGAALGVALDLRENRFLELEKGGVALIHYFL